MHSMKCHLTSDFLRIELKIKTIAIPFFVVVGMLVIPLEYTTKYLVISFAYSLVAIVFLWVVLRNLIVYIHTCNTKYEFSPRRVIVQTGLSLVATLVVYTIIIHTDKLVQFHDYNIICHADKMRSTFGLLLVFAFFVNATYESLFLFVSLSEKAILLEEYKKATAEAQFQNLKNQLNPHFLFNSFNTLSEAIEENPRGAITMVQELSDVYRYVLNNSNEKTVPLANELQFAQSFCNILKMRFENKLTCSINIAQPLMQSYIPPLTLQLLLENAIKHNEISASHPLHITVDTDGDQWIRICNNKQARRSLSESNGLGLNNINERYLLLTGKTIRIDNNPENFCVYLPIIEKRVV